MAKSVSDLLDRIRSFPITSEDMADLLIAAIEGRLAPVPGTPRPAARKKRGRRPIDDCEALVEVRLHTAS